MTLSFRPNLYSPVHSILIQPALILKRRPNCRTRSDNYAHLLIKRVNFLSHHLVTQNEAILFSHFISYLISKYSNTKKLYIFLSHFLIVDSCLAISMSWFADSNNLFFLIYLILLIYFYFLWICFFDSLLISLFCSINFGKKHKRIRKVTPKTPEYMCGRKSVLMVAEFVATIIFN